MRYLFSVLAMLGLLTPSFVHAQTSTDVYGDAVIAYSMVDLLSPNNAALAPDGAYADFKDEEIYLTIDMGEGEEGRGDLVMTIRVFDYGATARVTFYDADMGNLGTGSSIFSPGATTATITYTGEEKYRFVKIESPETEQWGLDAVQATQVDTPSASDDDDQDVEEEEMIPYGESDDLAGDLIRTAESSAVYLVGEDGKRHAFPNETIFTSWGYDFADVEYVSSEKMASYSLGENVTVRPGTWLVKITFDPKVYAVGMDGVLHWVTSEGVASAIYGADWSERVIDVNEVFWNNYTKGTDLGSAQDYPVGSVVTDGGVEYLLESTGFRELNDDEFSLLRFDQDFVLDGTVSSEDITPDDPENDDLSDDYHAY